MLKKINILYYIDGNAIGGAEQHLYQLVKSINSSVFKPTIICPSLRVLDPWAKKIKRYSEVIRHSTIAVSQPTLWKYYKSADIIHFQLPTPVSCVFAIATAKLAGADKIIVTIHSPFPVCSKYPPKNGLVRQNFKYINKVIAVSESSCRILTENFPINPFKIYVVHNGVDTHFYKKPCEKDILSVKKNFGIASRIPVIGTTGRLVKGKGFEFLVKAAPHILKNKHVKFVLIGNGEMKTKLIQLAEQYQVRNSFTFPGFKEDIHRILPMFDVFVLPSLYEGLPLSVLEAMSTEIPVVASRVPGNIEAVNDGVTGLLVPPKNPLALANAISYLLLNEQLASDMGIQGRKRIQKLFSLSQMVKSTEKIYFDILKHE